LYNAWWGCGKCLVESLPLLLPLLSPLAQAQILLQVGEAEEAQEASKIWNLFFCAILDLPSWYRPRCCCNWGRPRRRAEVLAPRFWAMLTCHR